MLPRPLLSHYEKGMVNPRRKGTRHAAKMPKSQGMSVRKSTSEACSRSSVNVLQVQEEEAVPPTTPPHKYHQIM